MAVCPNCKAQQPDGAAFCDECGAKLGGGMPAAGGAAGAPAPPAAPHTPTAVATTCQVCGARVSAGEAFCDNCGAALGQAASADVPSPPPPSPVQQPVGPVCARCGMQLEPGSKFCDMCGTPVTEQPAPAAQQPAAVPPPAPVPAPQPPDTHPAVTPQAPAAPQPAVAGVPGKLVVQATTTALPFPSGRTEIFIGREDPVSGVFPEIDLTDHGGDEGGVSRKHARIFVQGGQVYIEDLNSTNHTYVNQQRITPGQAHPLNDGDELRFGRVRTNYYAA